MKHKKFYSIISAIIIILSTPAFAESELPEPHDDLTLIGQAHPALKGINRLYVIVEPGAPGEGKDGLIWADLQKQIEDKIKKVGIEIEPGIHLGKGMRAHNVPELRVYMELLKFADSDLYVFRTQVALATMVYLQQQDLYFKAEVWKSDAAMQAAKVKDMPDFVTNAILVQVEAFLQSHSAANPQGVKSSNVGDRPVSRPIQPREAKQPTRPATAEYQFVASKNSKVFHRPDCEWAQKIKQENLVRFKTREDAINSGRRPCKICKP